MRSDQSSWNRQRRKDKGWPPPGLRHGVEAAQLGWGFEDVHLGEATRRFLEGISVWALSFNGGEHLNLFQGSWECDSDERHENRMGGKEN